MRPGTTRAGSTGPWHRDGPGEAADDTGYQSEQILATTLFRVYRSIGGDSADLGRRAVRLAHDDVSHSAGDQYPDAGHESQQRPRLCQRADSGRLLNWTARGDVGGAYNKVIRWSFEKQGLYQAQGAPMPVTRAGEPPDVDVYIDDGRHGEYPYQAVYWNNPSVWNRTARDGGATHQEPARASPITPTSGSKTVAQRRPRMSESGASTASRAGGRSGQTTFSPLPRRNWRPTRWPPAMPRRRSSDRSPGSPPPMPRDGTASCW